MKLRNVIQDRHNYNLQLLKICPTITVDGKKTIEAFAVKYFYFFENIGQVDYNIERNYDELPQHSLDANERENIFNQIKESDIFDKDRNSRRFAIQAKYEDGITPSCMPYIQFLIRNKTLHCFVSFRSQNIKNFVYDNVSILIFSRYLLDKYKCDNLSINVNIASLHHILN